MIGTCEWVIGMVWSMMDWYDVRIILLARVSGWLVGTVWFGMLIGSEIVWLFVVRNDDWLIVILLWWMVSWRHYYLLLPSAAEASWWILPDWMEVSSAKRWIFDVPTVLTRRIKVVAFWDLRRANCQPIMMRLIVENCVFARATAGRPNCVYYYCYIACGF